MQEEAIKRAIDTAYRAKGFAEKLHREGYIRRGDIVREVRERILSLETEQYPAFVITAILETAEVLRRMLDKANYDSGERKYYPMREKGAHMELIVAILRAFFEQTEVNPASISEVEISPAVAPGEWYMHVQPEQSWYAVMNYVAGQWLVAQYEYLTDESTDQGA